MYFNYAKVRWDLFSPQDIYFKSSILTRGLEDEINIISYKNKGDFHQNYENGVFVKFNHVKDDYPNVEINLMDKRVRKNGSRPMYRHQYFDNLVYIYSYHEMKEWVKDPTDPTGWKIVTKGQPLPNEEGYAIDFHNFQGYSQEVCQEQMDIVYSVRNFLIERILPMKQKKVLTMVA